MATLLNCPMSQDPSVQLDGILNSLISGLLGKAHSPGSLSLLGTIPMCFLRPPDRAEAESFGSYGETMEF